MLWTDRTKERRGLYYLADFDRAQLALDTADTLGFNDGNGIIETSEGLILTINTNGAQMYSLEKLLATFVREFEGNGRVLVFSKADANKIEVDQPNRLPGWQPEDQLLVFWCDIAEATGAVAQFGDMGC